MRNIFIRMNQGCARALTARRLRSRGLVLAGLLMLAPTLLLAQWKPPAEVPREEVVRMSEAVLSLPDIKLKESEDIVRVRVHDMDWDVGGMVFEPEDASRIPTGPDGRKIGIFMLHGGGGDHRELIPRARLVASKFGYKVVTMTYPGQLYFPDPSRRWPGDTINADGTFRMPYYTRDSVITHDQYEPRRVKGFNKYGTMILACAKPDTEFYARMSSWPVAFEESGKALMAKHLPASAYSIYIHGHSTGGPFSFMFTQRVPNIVGVVGIENSPFGYIMRVQMRNDGDSSGRTIGDLPFECLNIRTWRDRARYAGIEALMQQGPEALLELPVLMEKVLEQSEGGDSRPSIKAQTPIHFGSTHQLAQMARAAAKRLKLNAVETNRLIDKYVFYSREMWGDGVKPVPPVIFGVVLASGDHSPERYKSVTIPMYAAMDPPPKVSLVELKAGTHGYANAEPGLPLGVLPAIANIWHEAITNGYYLDYAKKWGGAK